MFACKSSTLFCALVPLLLSACGGGGGDSATTATPFSGFTGGAVSLQFAAQSGSTTVGCAASAAGLGTTQVAGAVKDLRFYMANVNFVKEDGTLVPLVLNVANGDLWNAKNATDTLTLLDLEDGTGECAGGTTATNALITGTVPEGRYVGVKMTMGVPESLNHLDPMDAATPLALSSTALGWSWTTGRIFSKIEVTDPAKATAPTWSAPVFTAHLGASNCVGDPAAGQTASCSIPNRMVFTLGDTTTPFNPGSQKVVLDLQALLAGNNVTQNTTGTASGCMSGRDDPECVPMFQALKIDLATGQPIQNGLGQQAFKVAAK